MSEIGMNQNNKNTGFFFDERLDIDEDRGLKGECDFIQSKGPGGEHSMTILNEGKSPKIKDIQELGKQAALSTKEINQSIDKVMNAVQQWPAFAQSLGVRNNSVKEIQSFITHNIKTFFYK